ncbi:MAG: thiamine biosynthesis protein thio [Comamonadaceae bacterium CG1_02_60_18]|nr:MAG: thiamine biosynthesis protein thio [Comamonadaceae bacterium CG1_02_60_18]PIQ52102.1 MAG: FAD-dependent oxidoreductase [Comamonadaceae bacterium CG12_big_fil_rev_8_21_14_0_65_59_15]
MATPLKIGIAGAGLLGRLTAWQLAHAGHQVSVFDPADGPLPSFDGQGAAGFTAAGMLSPLAELDATDPDLAERGWYSIDRWAQISARVARQGKHQPHFECNGSLLVAHGPDLGAAQRVLAHIEKGSRGWPQQVVPVDAARLHELEPALHASQGRLHAWLLPGEAAVCTPCMLKALHASAPNVQWHWQQRVTTLRAAADASTGAQLETTAPDGSTASTHSFDWVFDLRGAGARDATPVRGVRGETVWLHAPGVELRRAVRLLHPRHRVYLVPRRKDVIFLGASELESDDRSEVSLRSAVELMAAAHSIIPALAEARIVRLDRNLRPALPDNRPEIHIEDGLVRINGLYRHGWLLAPSLVDDALARTELVT